jgi:hypothetical protein
MKQMKRIIAHWTGGLGLAASKDLKHYHRLVQSDASVVFGTEEIADNIVTSDGDYAAHTLNINTASIGVALCGMAGAMERPFLAGHVPINEKQFKRFCRLIAELCIEYSIPVTPETVLTHAEVEPNLGVKQRGKWDITRLPWRSDIKGARAVGDYMRELVAGYVGDDVTPTHYHPVLRFGARGAHVSALQEDLAGLGYFSGRRDGKFGQLTRAALLAFQADNGLTTDAVAGPATWSTLATAPKRKSRDVSEGDLESSPGAIKDRSLSNFAGNLLGAGSLGAIATQVKETSQAIEKTHEGVSRLSALVGDNWPLLIAFAICAAGWVALRLINKRARDRQVSDARENRNLAA